LKTLISAPSWKKDARVGKGLGEFHRALSSNLREARAENQRLPTKQSIEGEQGKPEIKGIRKPKGSLIGTGTTQPRQAASKKRR